MEDHIELMLHSEKQISSWMTYGDFCDYAMLADYEFFPRFGLDEQNAYNADSSEGVLTRAGVRVPTVREYEKIRDAYIRNSAPHPSRKTNYRLRILPRLECAPANSVDDWPCLYLEWFRNLSNVSNILRIELGQAFWNKAKIVSRETMMDHTINDRENITVLGASQRT